jgi:hypothetical protein
MHFLTYREHCRYKPCKATLRPKMEPMFAPEEINSSKRTRLHKHFLVHASSPPPCLEINYKVAILNSFLGVINPLSRHLSGNSGNEKISNT